MSTPQSQQIKQLKEQVNSEILRRHNLEQAVEDYFRAQENLRRAAGIREAD